MNENQRMFQRVKIDSMIERLPMNEQNEILKLIEDFQTILERDDLSDETLTLLVFMYKKGIK